GIGAGAHVRVEPRDPQPVALRDGLHLVEILVPDPEARRGAAGVGPLGGSGPEPGIHPDRDLGRRRDRIWEVSWISAGWKPAWIARSTSKSLDASTWRPSSRNTRSIPRDGFA